VQAISPTAVTQHQDQLELSTSQITGLDAELALLAPLDSPALTGTPTAPTAATGTNTTQIATTAFVLANGAGPKRLVVVATTVSLAAQATDGTTVAAIGKSGTRLRVHTDRPARVRLYATAAALTADTGRLVGVDPTGEAEVLLDLVTTPSTLDFVLSPKVPYSNDETAPVATLPMSVQNLDTITSTVTVTFTYLTMET
jgi:hypothetical protein